MRLKNLIISYRKQGASKVDVNTRAERFCRAIVALEEFGCNEGFSLETLSTLIPGFPHLTYIQEGLSTGVFESLGNNTFKTII